MGARCILPSKCAHLDKPKIKSRIAESSCPARIANQGFYLGQASDVTLTS